MKNYTVHYTFNVEACSEDEAEAEARFKMEADGPDFIDVEEIE